jgi:hypothetical protein
MANFRFENSISLLGNSLLSVLFTRMCKLLLRSRQLTMYKLERINAFSVSILLWKTQYIIMYIAKFNTERDLFY